MGVSARDRELVRIMNGKKGPDWTITSVQLLPLHLADGKLL
jgi:hypothetical protein